MIGRIHLLRFLIQRLVDCHHGVLVIVVAVTDFVPGQHQAEPSDPVNDRSRAAPSSAAVLRPARSAGIGDPRRSAP